MLIHQEQTDACLWGIWKMDESPEELLLTLTEKNDLEIFIRNTTSTARITERIAVRVLLKTLLGEEKTIAYQPNGKPYLDDGSINLSISHTKEYVAVIVSHSPLLGIDIEYISDRVKRIRSRFVSDSEYIDPHNQTLHLLLHWSAKETIYKALSQEGIDLRKDFHIHPFQPQQQGVFEASETFTDHHHHFEVSYLVTDTFVVTYTV